jgi:predicted nucleic acid-binding protein
MQSFVIRLNDSINWRVRSSGWKRCLTDFLANNAKQEISTLRRLKRGQASETTDKQQLEPMSRQVNNTAIVNTARDGGAGMIVTGDSHLLRLKSFKGIKIVSVSEALQQLNEYR